VTAASVSDWAPFITALLGVAGALGALWKYFAERRRQHELEIEQRVRDREQREIDSLRRFDEKFAAAIGTLGSDDPATQASAAISISLLTFSRDEYRAFRSQVFLILVTTLERTKVEELQFGDVIRQLLVASVEQAIPVQLADLQQSISRHQARLGHGLPPKQRKFDLSSRYLNKISLAELDFEPVVLDVSRAWLPDANLAGTNAKGLRAYQASLEGADLTLANLDAAVFDGSLCRGTSFVGSSLDEAHFSGAVLDFADFTGASLRGTHFSESTLLGVSFTEAEIENATFRGAAFDEQTVFSILRAHDWARADFDPEIAQRLRELAADTNIEGKTGSRRSGV